MRKSARNAQKITLATAVFDQSGRILVDNNGIMPNAVVTDAFIEKVRTGLVNSGLKSMTLIAMDIDRMERASPNRTRYSSGCSK